MARGKKPRVNSRKRKASRNGGKIVKKRRNNDFKRKGNTPQRDTSEDNVKYRRINEKELETKAAVAVEKDDDESSDEEIDQKTSLEELISTFDGSAQQMIESSESESELSDEKEVVDAELSEEEEISEVEEDEEISEEEAVVDEKLEDQLSLHFGRELDEVSVKQILSRSDRVSKELNLNRLGKVTFTSTTQLSNFHLAPHRKEVSKVEIEPELWSVVASYTDLLLSQTQNYQHSNLVNTVCTHVLDHVLKSRAKILRHNAKLKRNSELEYRDQGLTRPKVLILLPFRSSAVEYVNSVCSIVSADEGTVVMNKKRFYDEYASVDAETEKKRLSRRPADYQQTFAGNTDDNFRLGIGVKKKCVRLYAPFYSSDILLASPLGLRMAVNDDHDFLSSIEILILDQPEVMMMQNWEHVLQVMEQLHLQPKDSHGVDFSRVRLWSLETDWAKCFRQTLVLSSLMSCELVALFNRFCFNHAGLIVQKADTEGGDILRVAVQLPNTFQRFQVSSPKEDPDERFKFFTEVVFPQYRQAVMTGTLIFVSSYFDFVRLRNYFRGQDVNFAQICEYQDSGKTAEARDKFFHRHRKFLLYTERTHFYKRYVIKGVRHVLFYQLPLIPRFYSELCNFILHRGRGKAGEEDVESSCSVLVSRYDSYRLAAVIGHDRASKILSNANRVHLLVSGDI